MGFLRTLMKELLKFLQAINSILKFIVILTYLELNSDLMDMLKEILVHTLSGKNYQFVKTWKLTNNL